MSGDDNNDDTKYYRLWSVATKGYLVLTVKNENERSVTFKETISEDKTGESSKVRIEEARAGPSAISYRIVFTLYDNKSKKEYALHVENNTVTAIEVPNENATYFTPTESVNQPFAAWEVMSHGKGSGKYIAANKDGRLSVQAFDSAECRQSATFVKIEICPERKVGQ